MAGTKVMHNNERKESKKEYVDIYKFVLFSALLPTTRTRGEQNKKKTLGKVKYIK
jgi:hypothetical protein